MVGCTPSTVRVSDPEATVAHPNGEACFGVVWGPALVRLDLQLWVVLLATVVIFFRGVGIQGATRPTGADTVE